LQSATPITVLTNTVERRLSYLHVTTHDYTTNVEIVLIEIVYIHAPRILRVIRNRQIFSTVV